jgi:hypothetical protein
VGKQGMFRGTLDGGQRMVGIQKLEYTLVAQFHDYFFDQTLVARDLDIFHFFGAEPTGIPTRKGGFLQRILQHREHRNGKEMMDKGNNG